MTVFFIFSLAIATSFIPVTCADDVKTLVLVQILFRHGDRSPINEFPTDPNKGHFANIGAGQLTTIGKQQHLALGKYFRERYGNFLSKRYHMDNVTIRSTDYDRTLMSAYSNLAGLFPPEGDQIWEPSIPWQPIPVHTAPQNEDWLLLTDNVCAKYKKLLEEAKHSEEMQKLDAENKVLYENLTRWAGYNVTNIFDVGSVYDTLFIETLYKIPTPDWSKDIYERLHKISAESFIWYLKDFELQKYAIGPLVGEMIKNMKEKIEGKINAKQLFMYSAHDTTVSALLAALQLYNGIPPPYTATVLAELYKLNGGYIVEISYKNSTEDPFPLAIPGCTTPCPFKQFSELYADVAPKDIKSECKVDDGIISNASLTVLIITGCLVVIFFGVLILGGICWRRRRNSGHRYNMIISE